MLQFTVYIYSNAKGSTSGELDEKILDIYTDTRENVRHVVSALYDVKKIVSMIVVEKEKLQLALTN